MTAALTSPAVRSRFARAALERLLRAAALAIPLACTGCFTMLAWTGAPRVHTHHLVGANVDAAGDLTVGVEFSDGRVATFRETTRSCGMLGPDQTCFLAMTAVDSEGGRPPTFACLPSPADGRIELPSTLKIACEGGGPLALVVNRRSGGRIEIVTADGQRRGCVEIPDPGDTNWSHPVTWFCIVATPVTAVADVVLFPLEVLFVYAIFPKA